MLAALRGWMEGSRWVGVGEPSTASMPDRSAPLGWACAA